MSSSRQQETSSSSGLCKYVWVKERELDHAHRWFERYGHEAVFFGRMVPVIRAFISVPAGIAEMNIAKFIVYTFLGVLPWSIALTYLGYFLGSQWQEITKYFTLISIIVVILLGLSLLVFVVRHLRRKNKERRGIRGTISL